MEWEQNDLAEGFVLERKGAISKKSEGAHPYADLQIVLILLWYPVVVKLQRKLYFRDQAIILKFKSVQI